MLTPKDGAYGCERLMGKQQELCQRPLARDNAAGFQGWVLPPPTPDMQKYLHLCSSAQLPLGK